MSEQRYDISVTVNGSRYEATVPGRRTLCDFVRNDLGLTGTHVGCEHGVCGACTVLLDGAPVRSCLVFAVSANGHAVVTVEGLGQLDEEGRPESLSPVQQAFRDTHALQCGFCTPGMIMQSVDLLNENPDPSEEDVRLGLEGNLCRCTGYHNIVKSVLHAAAQGGDAK